MIIGGAKNRCKNTKFCTIFFSLFYCKTMAFTMANMANKKPTEMLIFNWLCNILNYGNYGFTMAIIQNQSIFLQMGFKKTF